MIDIEIYHSVMLAAATIQDQVIRITLSCMATSNQGFIKTIAHRANGFNYVFAVAQFFSEAGDLYINGTFRCGIMSAIYTLQEIVTRKHFSWLRCEYL